jgi:hypothetical protein
MIFALQVSEPTVSSEVLIYPPQADLVQRRLDRPRLRFGGLTDVALQRSTPRHKGRRAKRRGRGR